MVQIAWQGLPDSHEQCPADLRADAAAGRQPEIPIAATAWNVSCYRPRNQLESAFERRSRLSGSGIGNGGTPPGGAPTSSERAECVRGPLPGPKRYRLMATSMSTKSVSAQVLRAGVAITGGST